MSEAGNAEPMQVTRNGPEIGPSGLAAAAENLRRDDPDRRLLAMMAPSRHRAALIALYAANLDIARIPERVSEPILGQMRLQWWLDALSGERPPSNGSLAGDVCAALDAYGLTPELLLEIIGARRADLESGAPPASLVELIEFAAATGGALAALSLQMLRGGPAAPSTTAEDAAARHAGTAFALVGLARATPFHIAGSRCYLPADLLPGGASAQPAAHGPASDAVRHAVRTVCQAAKDEIARARKIVRRPDRDTLTAFAPATLAESYVKALATVGYDPYHPRVRYRGFGAAAKLATFRLLGRY